MRVILDNKIAALSKPSTTYEQGWEYKQAEFNGRLDELSFLKKLLTE